MEKFEYLIFSGGGPNGFLHLGGVRFLEHILYPVSILNHFNAFAGTSVGSLIAFCLASGLSTQIILKKLKILLPSILTLDVSLFSLHDTSGLRSIQPLQRLIEEILWHQFRCYDITFQKLYDINLGKELTICACNLLTNKVQLFNRRTTPAVSVKQAVLASMSIPFVFPPITINDQLYIDGGCQLNLPIGAYPLSKSLAMWIHEHPIPVEKQRVLDHLTVLTTQVVKCFFYAQNSVVEYYFYQKFPDHFIRLASFTTGFLPTPLKNINGPIHTGFLTTGLQLLTVVGSKDRLIVLHWLILGHLYLYVPRAFILWVLSQIVAYTVITVSILDEGHRGLRVDC